MRFVNNYSKKFAYLVVQTVAVASWACASLQLPATSSVPLLGRACPSSAAGSGRVAASRATNEAGLDGRDEATGKRAAAAARAEAATTPTAAGVQPRHGVATLLAEASELACSPEVVAVGLARLVDAYTT